MRTGFLLLALFALITCVATPMPIPPSVDVELLELRESDPGVVRLSGDPGAINVEGISGLRVSSVASWSQAARESDGAFSTHLGGATNEIFREYLACERNCDAARHTFPQRTIRDARYKLIHSPVRDREDPAARYYRTHGASHWSGCLTDEELADASTET